MLTSLPLPTFFDPQRVGEVWRVPYEMRAAEAALWAKEHELTPAVMDEKRVCLLAIDVQNTFCIPDYELFVGGRSGRGAVDDNVRLCEFIYRNLGSITAIAATMDTHTATQIFHAVFWINEAGEHPPAMTMISLEDVETGVWRVNPAIAPNIAYGTADSLQAYALYYVRKLSQDGKYPLTIWPYHSMLGGIGHALVSAVEEACFFHSIARQAQTLFELKGGHPLTENYSVLKPEVTEDAQQRAIPAGIASRIAQKNLPLISMLLDFDAVLIAGQAKSHCVAWTIDDLLTEIQAIHPKLADRIYLLEDCSSPVVVPGVVDFTDAADAAYERFAAAGMHRVKSTEPMASWLQ
ncbi:isochorismatase [Thermoleptolyngbya sichuanensis XZ-Cy5]|uniref:isochorismatase n=1 Tax=Thermoleptolyngbya sichuanensis TaxID=2885951 RepID=UPI00240DE882|nr:isochorismatase [Thermoleptolyngbya sichuanensis]MDG2617195.1 isochorismatase [Thermoleptolyngbya sichuanensis XZ-Cy5]